MAKVLLVEDDQTLIQVLGYNLNKEGYSVITASDGMRGLELARSEKPDLIILDIMLPQLNGFEVCRILRKETAVPILMLTAKDEEVDKIVGLEIGADDYVTKPFSLRELLARIRALLRRAQTLKVQSNNGIVIHIKKLSIDTARRTASIRSKQLILTPKEFDLLTFLARNKNIVFSREQLLQKVWGYEYAGDTRTVDVHVRWLRQKIEENPAQPEYIVSIRGVGYKLEGQDAK